MLQKKLLTEFPLFLAWGRKDRREVRRREEKKFLKKIKKKRKDRWTDTGVFHLTEHQENLKNQTKQYFPVLTHETGLLLSLGT